MFNRYRVDWKDSILGWRLYDFYLFRNYAIKICTKKVINPECVKAWRVVDLKRNETVTIERTNYVYKNK